MGRRLLRLGVWSMVLERTFNRIDVAQRREIEARPWRVRQFTPLQRARQCLTTARAARRV